MDSVRRLTWFIVGVLLAAVLVPAFGQTYEYTGKVAATTGGQSKTSQPQTGTGYWKNASICTTINSTSDSTISAAAQRCISYYQSQYPPPNCYSLGAVTPGNSSGTYILNYGNPTCANQASETVYAYCDNNGASGWSLKAGNNDPPQCQGPATMQCPQGTVEGAGGLCYPLVCPTATSGNQWEQDPANSNQCRRVTVCPWAASWSDGTCVCPNSAATSQAQYGVTEFTLPGQLAPGATACLGGCQVQVMNGAANVKLSSGWETVARVIGTSSSTFCSQPAPSPNKAADTVANEEATCLQAGGSWGTVNGTGQCLPKGGAGTTVVNGTPTSTSSTTNNPNGTSTVTTTTTTPVTTCTNGSCNTTNTVTTTTTNYSGPNGTGTASSGGGSTTTTTGPSQPGGGGGGNGTGTGTESSFGGSCQAGFACQGDAVQCAIAQEQYKRDCQLWDPKAGVTGPTSGDAEAYFGSIGSLSASSLSSTATSLATLDESSFLGGGALSDLTVTFMGKPFVVPFSNLNNVLNILGNVTMILAGLVCMSIYRKLL